LEECKRKISQEPIVKVLITGASGYLGANLAKLLHTSNPELSLVLASRGGNCEWIRGFGEQISLKLDGREHVPELPKDIDVIVHLAALNEIDCGQNLHDALQINVQGTRQIIDAGIKDGVKKFVYASTIHIYGPLEGTLTESSLPRAIHPYGYTHYMAEELMEHATVKYGVEATVLRFANVIGAPLHMNVNRWSLLVNDLCKQAMTTGKLLLKSPSSKRDFVPMKDACQAFRHAVLSKNPDENRFQVFNISSAKNIEVLRMAHFIRDKSRSALGINVEIVSDASNSKSEKDFVISNEKTLAWGWKPSSDLISEIEDTLAKCHQFFSERK
jgi:UDP-glucose 4-epimerase